MSLLLTHQKFIILNSLQKQMKAASVDFAPCPLPPARRRRQDDGRSSGTPLSAFTMPSLTASPTYGAMVSLRGRPFRTDQSHTRSAQHTGHPKFRCTCVNFACTYHTVCPLMSLFLRVSLKDSAECYYTQC